MPHSTLHGKKDFSTQEIEYLSHLRFAIDQHAIISIANAAGDIIDVNDKFCEISGYSRDELIGKNHRLLKSAEHSPAFFRQMWMTIASGKVWQGEICNLNKQGQEYWVRSTIIPFLDENGLPLQYLSIRTDITYTKLAEGKLRVFRRLVETTEQAIRVSDAEGRIQYVNPAYERLLGYRSREVLGRDFVAVGTAGQQEERVAEVLKTLAEGKSWTGLLKLTRKDGSELMSLSNLCPIMDPNTGKLANTFNMFVDYSAEIERQQALEQAVEQANEANQAKSEFLSRMSHELRTPMNAIIGFSSLMEMDDELSEDNRDNVNEIIKASRHLLQLINEVLDLTRVEARKVELSIEPVDCVVLVEECHSLLRPLLEKSEVSLKISLPEPFIVRADHIRLKQVLLNLISNAIKYNRRGGKVCIQGEAVETASGHFLRLHVQDTGNGIAPERMKELFRPFNRLGAEYGEIEGTGIGLVITHSLVELMGGHIGVESELGKGSDFWIELPAEVLPELVDTTVPATTLPATAEAESDKQQRRYTVLYIEDNPANIKLVTQALARLPHISLFTAHTPSLGLDLAHHHQPDLILLDINLPGMNGYQVLAELKNRTRTASIPVIAITANAMRRDIERGKQAGFAEYLTKPLDISLFLRTVNEFLERSV